MSTVRSLTRPRTPNKDCKGRKRSPSDMLSITTEKRMKSTLAKVGKAPIVAMTKATRASPINSMATMGSDGMMRRTMATTRGKARAGALEATGRMNLGLTRRRAGAEELGEEPPSPGTTTIGLDPTTTSMRPMTKRAKIPILGKEATSITQMRGTRRLERRTTSLRRNTIPRLRGMRVGKGSRLVSTTSLPLVRKSSRKSSTSAKWSIAGPRKGRR